MVVCNDFSFIRSFIKLNLIFTNYSSITCRCVFNDAITVAVHVIVYIYCCYGICVPSGCFLSLSVVDVDLLPWLSMYTPFSIYHKCHTANYKGPTYRGEKRGGLWWHALFVHGLSSIGCWPLLLSMEWLIHYKYFISKCLYYTSPK